MSVSSADLQYFDPRGPLDRYGVIHLCGFIEEDLSAHWLVKVNVYTNYMLSDGIINVHFHMKGESCRGERHALNLACHALAHNRVDWLIPNVKYWTLNVDRLIHDMPGLGPAVSKFVWAKGDLQVVPEYEFDSEGPYPQNLTLSLSPEAKEVNVPPPREILESLLALRRDHADPTKTGFVIMRFGSTTSHERILAAIRTGLALHGLTGLRADDKQYHDDLYHNIMTYMYGCGFGIAVYERIESEEFNPNVSLEIGGMLVMGKPVCFLKDRTLRTLNTDLVGKLYKPFDPLDPDRTIPPQLTNWVRDKGLI